MVCLQTSIQPRNFPTYLGSPPGSPFHGFGTEVDIPGRLMIKTVFLDDGEEVLEGIRREKREQQNCRRFPLLLGRREERNPLPSEEQVLPECWTSLKYFKIPTKGAVLGRFLSNLEKSSVKRQLLR